MQPKKEGVIFKRDLVIFSHRFHISSLHVTPGKVQFSLGVTRDARMLLKGASHSGCSGPTLFLGRGLQVPFEPGRSNWAPKNDFLEVVGNIQRDNFRDRRQYSVAQHCTLDIHGLAEPFT